MQARVRETQEVIEVIPKPEGNVLKFYDIVNERFYTWDDLEPVRVKSATESIQAVAVGVKVNPTVTGFMTTKKTKPLN